MLVIEWSINFKWLDCLPINLFSIPAVVNAIRFCSNLLVIARLIRKIRPELLRIFDFLLNILHKFIQMWLLIIVILIVCIEVAAILIIPVLIRSPTSWSRSSSLTVSIISVNVVVSRKLHWFVLDLLAVSSITMWSVVLISCWICGSLGSFNGLFSFFAFFEFNLLTVINEKISVGVADRLDRSSSSTIAS